MSTKTGGRGISLRFVKTWRWVLIVILIFNLIVGPLDIVTGTSIAFVPFVMAAALVGALVLNAKTIRLRTAQLRPTPDYSLIARMERPIWGQAFEHAGAPQIARMEREVFGGRAHCIGCGTPQPVARGRCADCYREWQRRYPGER